VTNGQIFAEFVLEALIKKGVPRFIAYRDVQRVAFSAHDKGMDYIDAVKNDPAISSKLTEKEIEKIFSPESHLGASPEIIANVNNMVQRACKKFI
jgi:adenylosuccinate lyase